MCISLRDFISASLAGTPVTGKRRQTMEMGNVLRNAKIPATGLRGFFDVRVNADQRELRSLKIGVR